MLYFSKWKTLMILGAVLLGFFFAAPNAMNSDLRDNMPGMFQRTINLGLDLQGGAHMLLEVDLSSVVENELNNQRDSVLGELREADRIRTEYVRVDGDTIVGKFRNPDDVERGMSILRKLAVPVDPTSLVQSKTIKVDKTGERDFRVSITPENIEAIKDRTIAQSIEVLRKRIDPQGTTEMTLAKEGSDRIPVSYTHLTLPTTPYV